MGTSEKHEKEREHREQRQYFRQLDEKLIRNEGTYYSTKLLEGQKSLVEEVVEEANNVYRTVERPTEATYDSAVLVRATTMNLRKARNLKDVTSEFDWSQFIEKITRYTESDTPDFSFKKLGQLAYKHLTRPVGVDFMLGPVAIEKIVKERRKFVRDEIEELKMAEQIDKRELKKSSKTAASSLVKEMYQSISKHFATNNITSMDLFEIIVNPQSFSQTVENMYNLSFLISNGNLMIKSNENGLPEVIIVPEIPDNDEEEGERRRQLPRNQLIMDMNVPVWEDLIKVFNITESFIASRDNEAMSTGQSISTWYG
ncbi:hypothetical protein NADFUDRAFT_45417 [Nadsonia fulvescens var. elongata DSM 6958]|uniref:Non-structural maintenance of chromosomes element 4 n=1 Tax=Nadsonia fulvescens var. elongata DSM 6958 TaxID=857566 RepID=A0A1E3PPU0_9ASCO|nr:hypothetical protein NADFUDRAFT_45417 [Nadsonia fulvescens var. elongata DSM 6958]